MKNEGIEITPATNSIILLCVVVPSAFAMLASTTLSKRYGYKTVVRCCGVIFALSPWVINISLTPVTLGLFYLLIPIAFMSIASVPVLNCLWSHFPGHLNKISGAVVFFFAVGTILFNLVFAFIVNPDN